MKSSSYLIGMVWGVLLLPVAGSAAPAPAAAFTSKVIAAPAHARVGKAANFSVSLVNKGAAAPNSNVDMEVYDAQNKKIAQHVWPAQNLAKGKGGAYRWAWKPSAAGTYTVKLGVFSRDWKTLRYWVDKALILPASR